jgi:hypothetical protein
MTPRGMLLGAGILSVARLGWTGRLRLAMFRLVMLLFSLVTSLRNAVTCFSLALGLFIFELL